MGELLNYHLIIDAVRRDDIEYLKLICEIVNMSDTAKQNLREKGYGWIGLDLLKTVDLVRDIKK